MDLLSNLINSFNSFLFTVLPYVAVIVFVIGAIYRYRSTNFNYSSLSSQFLEGNKLFWGSIPFHFGIMIVFFGHLFAFLMPETLLTWNAEPARLIILEVTGLIFALALLIGLTLLFIRRLTNDRIKVVTSKMDIVLEVVLLVQVVIGIWTAIGYRWGSSWFASDMTPYLWSLVKLSPDMTVVAAMPLVIQLHVILAFVIVFIIPFTRLVHFLVAPFHYVWRPYQRVIWNYNKDTVRDPNTEWTKHRPKNN